MNKEVRCLVFVNRDRLAKLRYGVTIEINTMNGSNDEKVADETEEHDAEEKSEQLPRTIDDYFNREEKEGNDGKDNGAIAEAMREQQRSKRAEGP